MEKEPITVNGLKDLKSELEDLKNVQRPKVVEAIADSATIRRTALQNKVYYTTTIAGAAALCEALRADIDMPVSRLQDLHQKVSIRAV